MSNPGVGGVKVTPAYGIGAACAYTSSPPIGLFGEYLNKLRPKLVSKLTDEMGRRIVTQRDSVARLPNHANGKPPGWPSRGSGSALNLEPFSILCKAITLGMNINDPW